MRISLFLIWWGRGYCIWGAMIAATKKERASKCIYVQYHLVLYALAQLIISWWLAGVRMHWSRHHHTATSHAGGGVLLAGWSLPSWKLLHAWSSERVAAARCLSSGLQGGGASECVEGKDDDEIITMIGRIMIMIKDFALLSLPFLFSLLYLLHVMDCIVISSGGIK